MIDIAPAEAGFSAERLERITEHLERNYVEPGKIAVVTNGIELDRFHPRPRDAALAAELGFAGKLVAGYIGTHGLAHGLETILDAAALVRARPGGGDFRFLLLGDGADKERLKRLACERGLDNVRFVDTVSKEDVPRYWSLLDVSIIHLKRAELFKTVIPSKLFESMGMGIPVLLGVEGESAEILAEAGAGEAFAPGDAGALADALRRLRAEPELASAWRRRGPAAARGYDRAELAARMEEVLEGVASGKRAETKVTR
ncbi:MAG: hypothetical protein B7X11_03265 [Acidobacteria bacterium 37-65-4]|nr:MAG: hypothetical protein B7X11_03265 [Acidobacteria bacterium 37-65-4]